MGFNPGHIDNPELRQYIVENKYLTPLEVLISLANGDHSKFKGKNAREKKLGIPLYLRMSAAAAAVNFVHKKLPSLVTVEHKHKLSDAITKARDRSLPVNSLIDVTPEGKPYANNQRNEFETKPGRDSKA